MGQVVQDRTWLTGLFFYLPSPLVAAGLLLFAVLLWYAARRLGRIRYLALLVAASAVAPALATVFVDHQWTAPPVTATREQHSIRVVHWNIWYGRLGWKRVLEDLITVDADLVMLSEVLPEADLDRLAAVFDPPYTAHRAGNMVILARGNMTPPRRLGTKPARVYEVDWDVESAETTLRLFMVDVPSNPLVKRVPALADVARFMEERHPDLVLGDFNTPRRSRGLAHLPAGYVHAYEAAGRGWSYTWPCPLPMLSIDQCILGPRLVPVSYELRTLSASDHRMQVADVVIAGETPEGG
ncbi:MAG: hypothetical protein GY851_20665 [bacterium]|nr:hypothetical protein [bacterium]